MRTLNRTSPRTRRGPRGPRAGANRAGFSLVEVIVAIVLVAVGMIALASSSAVVLREMNAGKQASVAASLTAERFERFRSYNRCVALDTVSRVDTIRGVAHRVRVGATQGAGRNGWRDVVDTVSYRTRGGALTQRVYATRIPCSRI